MKCFVCVCVCYLLSYGCLYALQIIPLVSLRVCSSLMFLHNRKVIFCSCLADVFSVKVKGIFIPHKNLHQNMTRTQSNLVKKLSSLLSSFVYSELKDLFSFESEQITDFSFFRLP